MDCNDRFKLENGNELYIRIPREFEDDPQLIFELFGLAGKTLKISVIDNKDAPFENSAICADENGKSLRYFGSDSFWQPKGTTLTIVDGYPDCTPNECANCHVVSCGVYQGYTPCVPRIIGYLYSEQM